MIEELISFAFLGLFAGVISSSLGIGGGIIVIPSLYFLFNYFEVDAPSLMQLAVGTSLASMTFSTLSASISHCLHRHVLFAPLAYMAFLAIIGAIIGSFCVSQLSTLSYRRIFRVFEVCVAIYYLFRRPKKIWLIEEKFRAPLLMGAGLLIGFFGAFLGIGGGLLMMPFLLLLSYPIEKAVGTASCVSFIVTATAAINYTWLVKDNTPSSNPFLVGPVYLVAFVPIALCAIVGAPIGAYLLKRFSQRLVKPK